MKYRILNLHLFDTHVNVTTDARTSGQSYPQYNDLSAEMKTYYDMELLEEASANLVHDQFGQQRPIPAGSGKTTEFRKFTALAKATTPLTEGVTPDGKKLDTTTITATVAQYGDFIVQSDILELTAIDNTILEATKLLGRQAGLTLDTVTREIINAGDNVSYAPKIGADGTETAVTSRANLDTTAVLTVKLLQKVVAKLRGQNADPVDGTCYGGIIHPYNAYQLMRDPEWIDWHKYTNAEAMYKNEIGQIAGIRFVQSTEAKIVRNASHAVFCTLVCGKNAYGITSITGGALQTIVKQKGSSGVADPLDQRSSVGWKAIKTAEILADQYMVRVESCVPDFDSTAAN